VNPTGQKTRQRRFPLWVILAIAGVPICIGGLIIVALVAITALGTSGPNQTEARRVDPDIKDLETEVKTVQQMVSVDPDIKDLEFGKWSILHGHDGLGNEGIWLVTTVKAVGTKPVHSTDFKVELFNRESVKITGGYISLPDLKPGEIGEVRVRIDNAFRAVISNRRPNSPVASRKEADKQPVNNLTNTKPEKRDETILACGNMDSANEIYKAYQNNEAGADSKYLNNRVEFTISPWAIDKDPSGTYFAWSNLFGLSDDNTRGRHFKCYFRADQATALAAFKQGQILKIRGICAGKTGMIKTFYPGYNGASDSYKSNPAIAFKDCELVEKPK
jgi:hypothetical protein